MVYMVHIIILLSFGFTGTSSTNIIETFLKVEFYDHLLTCDADLINDEFNFEILDISNKCIKLILKYGIVLIVPLHWIPIMLLFS